MVVRRSSDGKVVARPSVEGGRFAVHLPPGSYRIHGYVAMECWTGETVHVAVTRSHVSFVRLYVRNSCVLAPQRAAARA